MKGEWCYFKSYFSKDFCNEIIKAGLTIPPSLPHVGDGVNSRVNNDYRRCKIRFLRGGDLRFKYLFDELWRCVIRANSDFFDVHISKLDYIQMAEYDSSTLDEYKAHHDVFWMNNDPNYHRKLTCLVQLSDPNDYEGGNFEITETSSFPNSEDIKQQGTIIVFPSMFMHKANPVTKGMRYSLAAWFDGPKWR